MERDRREGVQSVPKIPSAILAAAIGLAAFLEACQQSPRRELRPTPVVRTATATPTALITTPTSLGGFNIENRPDPNGINGSGIPITTGDATP